MSETPTPPTVLVASGVDSSGGAGLAADLRALEGCGVFGRSVVTSLTVQHSGGVEAVHPVDAAFVADQARAATRDGVDGVKLGLVPTPEVADALRNALPNVPLVVDPVLAATSGDALAGTGMRKAYLRLAARATLVTPNLAEARALTGLDEAEDAAWALHKEGAHNVLITGGDTDGERVTDLLLTRDGRVVRFNGTRHEGRFHGTGCTLAALAAAHLAQGYDARDAVEAAVHETRERILRAVPQPGARILPPGTTSLLADVRAHPPEARARAAAVARAWRTLHPHLERHHVPEVGMNLSYLPQDGGPERAAALRVRVTRAGRGAALTGTVEIGGIHHTARVAATAHRCNPGVRAGLNLRHRPQLVDAAQAAGLRIGSFRRADQPPDADSSMEWGTHHAHEHADGPLDLVYDEGGPGKEPMIRVLGADPADVVQKVRRILR